MIIINKYLTADYFSKYLIMPSMIEDEAIIPDTVNIV